MRMKLGDRRANETRKLTFAFANGREQSLLITIGFDDDGVPKEVFCADFKAGSDLHPIVMDACILVSRILQHGDLAADLSASMCKGPSLIGAIVAAVADSSGPNRRLGGGAPALPPRQPDAPADAAAMAADVT